MALSMKYIKELMISQKKMLKTMPIIGTYKGGQNEKLF